MKRAGFLSVLVIFAVLPASVFAADDALSVQLKKMRQLEHQRGIHQGAWTTKIEPLRVRVKQLEELAKEYEKRVPDQESGKRFVETIEKMDKQLARARKDLEGPRDELRRAESGAPGTFHIVGIKNRIAELERQIAKDEGTRKVAQEQLTLHRLADPAQRAKRKAEIPGEIAALQKQIETATKEAQAGIQQMEEAIKAHNPKVAEAFLPLLRPGKGAYVDARKIKPSTFMNVSNAYWIDDTKNPPPNVFFASFEYLPEKPKPFAEPLKVAGKYPASDFLGEGLEVLVGHFRVRVRTERKEWRGKGEEMLKWVEPLVDWDALANATGEPAPAK